MRREFIEKHTDLLNADPKERKYLKDFLGLGPICEKAFLTACGSKFNAYISCSIHTRYTYTFATCMQTGGRTSWDDFGSRSKCERDARLPGAASAAPVTLDATFSNVSSTTPWSTPSSSSTRLPMVRQVGSLERAHTRCLCRENRVHLQGLHFVGQHLQLRGTVVAAPGDSPSRALLRSYCEFCV